LFQTINSATTIAIKLIQFNYLIEIQYCFTTNHIGRPSRLSAWVHEQAGNQRVKRLSAWVHAQAGKEWKVAKKSLSLKGGWGNASFQLASEDANNLDS